MVEEGIALYNIESDNCLNGVYTNEDAHVRGTIYNEIARLKPKTKVGSDGISGVYDCFYYDIDNEAAQAILKVSVTGRVYQLEWSDIKGTLLFEGVGYKMNDKQLVAHYWSK